LLHHYPDVAKHFKDDVEKAKIPFADRNSKNPLNKIFGGIPAGSVDLPAGQ
jgi:hypothetical protein